MNVQPLKVDSVAAARALREYREHRSTYDKRDWEIERIYRAITKGKTVISARDAITGAGVDEKGRPKLAICQAHARSCRFDGHGNEAVFGIAPEGWGRCTQGRIRIPWPHVGYASGLALLPRIPPQHRPAANDLSRYHLLWEADWRDVPHDPYLLRRIGRDAWVVVAAWALTDVEVSVLRAHRT